MANLSIAPKLGKSAPDFSLPDTDGRIRSLAEFDGYSALLVAFICNHCPFVTHLIESFCDFAREYHPKGLGTVAISSNWPELFPEDDYEHMKEFSKRYDLPFPYLHDDSQDAALAFGAVCTPSFFLFDRHRRLFYAGQFDASRPKLNLKPNPGLPPLRTDLPITGDDLRRATDALLAREAPPASQAPSAGCSITWRPEKDPSWN